MDVTAFLDELRSSPEYAGQIVHVHVEPPRQARWAPIPDGLSPGVHTFLAAQGINRLYGHQASAISCLLEGQDVLLTTGPASGKSLCYQIPLLEKLLATPGATALLLFPTKALARDQAESWNRGIADLPDEADRAGLLAQPFDGDSSSGERRRAFDTGRVLVTNPEMLHANMLPGHGRWERFFHGLSLVVLDEVHTYTGFFGANMANVLRRLERICQHHGGRPQYVCCSATVGNPRELAERLTSRALRLVDDDGSSAGSRTFVFWNPPRIKRRHWRGRRSANVEAHELMASLIRQRVATICFAKARTTAEMIYRYVREALQRESPGLADRVIPYRGGYSPPQRRDMERRLRQGELLGVSATRALELGIDIGMLEACIVVGYPGLLSAFYQQAGRAGRAQTDSICFLVGIDTPINQYIMEHPEFIFERPVERVVVDRDNPFVVLGHVRCASLELPVQDAQAEHFGYAASLALEVLEENEKVYHSHGAWYHSAPEPPASEVRLRGYGDESAVVMDADSGEVIDRLDKFRALRIFYSGAIYFRHGDTYELVENDTDRNLITVRRVQVPYYTDPMTGTAVDHVDAILEQRPLGTGQACLGEVYAILDTPVYEKVEFYTLDRISQHPTHQPSIAYEAMSFWLIPPPTLVDEMIAHGLLPDSGMKGVLYCLTRILPLFLTSDANDFDWSLGSKNSSPHAMFWYEFYLHGIGNAEQCYERFEEMLHVALEHLLTCDCPDGCPNCTTRPITPYHVRNIELGEGGRPESRRAGIVVLNCVLNGRSVHESLALVDQPRAQRGQQYLPTFRDESRLAEPHQMRLDERLRGLMRRKLERERLPKPALDHPIDPIPQVGVPPPESEAQLAAADAEKRSGQEAIRRGSGNAARRLSKRLDAIGKQPRPPGAPRISEPSPAPAGEPSPPAATRPVAESPAPQPEEPCTAPVTEPSPAPAAKPTAEPSLPPTPAPSGGVAGEPPAHDAPKQPASAAAPIQTGDSVASRARKLKRRRPTDE